MGSPGGVQWAGDGTLDRAAEFFVVSADEAKMEVSRPPTGRCRPGGSPTSGSRARWAPIPARPPSRRRPS